jgi:UDP-N-acetylglucosamine 2-epimerase (non-hydrolysing)
MKRVVVALGTRPEVTKMAPVIFALRRQPGLEVLVLLTGQHREQVDSALAVFGIVPDVDLDVMIARQTLPDLAGKVVPVAAQALRDLAPDFVLVHGDTLSTFCVALASFFERLAVGHVEAGLRSGVIDEPFPEEASRRLTDVLTDLDLAPTPLAAQHLLAEGKPPDRVIVTGQTAVDAIRLAADMRPLPERWRGRRLVTVTMHRRENWVILGQLAAAVARVAREHPDRRFVYPMHLNPVVREAVVPVLGGLANVELIDPLDFASMAALMAASELIVTDSGGMIEEGVSLRVHVAILRNVTERPEGIEAGLATLVGTDPPRVYEQVSALLQSSSRAPNPGLADSPYGDGHAAERVAAATAWRLGLGPRPQDWEPKRSSAPAVTKPA